MMLDLSTLNDKQLEAVTTTEGAVLVLAGAGSGKTRVLTIRVAYLLDSGLAGPDNILAMTFTNKAAREMVERIEVLINEGENTNIVGKPTWVGTFHSICVRILKQYGGYVGLDRNFTIMDSSEQLQLVKDSMNEVNISIKEFKPNAIKSFISSAKNELIDPTSYEQFSQGYFQNAVSKVYYEYQKQLKDINAVDFDDLIMLTIKLFTENPDILKVFQLQFKYVLVDEYQDTNHAQYKLIKMFANEHKNICCVGDDDQSIYAFRGATIKNILNFEKDYSNTATIKLEQNYRSTKTILESAYCVISKNKGRKDKKLWTDNLEGEKLVVYKALDEKDEGEWITDKINVFSKTQKTSLDDFAILYRTNAQSRALEESFLQAGIPYKIIGGLKFYDRKEVKDILAYLKFLYNPKDLKNLERIINVPKRGIGKKALDELFAQAKEFDLKPGELILSLEHNVYNTKIAGFQYVARRLKENITKINIVDLINKVIEETSYLKMLDDGTSENQNRIENLKELVSVATKFINEQNGLELFLDEVSLIESLDNAKDQDERVTLMTIHSSKGLEFKYVFIAGAEESLFPHTASAMNEKELEEERRLAYVAITRAREHLFISHAKSRLYFGQTQRNPISRFINDIDIEYIERISNESIEDEYEDYGYRTKTVFRDSPKKKSDEFKNTFISVGDRVKHEYFGTGKILYLDDETVKIDFGAVYGVKELMLEYTRLEKL